MCVAGDIAALTKLGTAETGDTVSAASDPLLLSCWNLPDPLLPVAVVARSRADEDALGRSLTRLVAADPTLRLERNPETHQTVLWCMGEAHADVVLSRLRASGAEVDTEPVKVPLRATIRSAARVTGRHVKQSGGHGQYAVCHVEFEPLPRGSGFEFVSRVVGGAVPTQFIPSVEKGIRTQLERGLTEEHHPVVDVRAILVDGKAHSVDSSDAAFQTAGAVALREAGQACGTVLLEPLDEVAVTIPDDHLGAVLGDLSGRRGRVLGTDVARPGADGGARRGAVHGAAALRGRPAGDDVGDGVVHAPAGALRGWRPRRSPPALGGSRHAQRAQPRGRARGQEHDDDERRPPPGRERADGDSGGAGPAREPAAVEQGGRRHERDEQGGGTEVDVAVHAVGQAQPAAQGEAGEAQQVGAAGQGEQCGPGHRPAPGDGVPDAGRAGGRPAASRPSSPTSTGSPGGSTVAASRASTAAARPTRRASR